MANASVPYSGRSWRSLNKPTRLNYLSLPAIIICPPESEKRTVAALSVVDRLVVAAFRAGCSTICVVANAQPNLKRSQAWRIPFTVQDRCPEVEAPSLVVAATWLLQAPDLRQAIVQRGRLVTRSGILVPAGLVTTDDIAGQVPASFSTSENVLKVLSRRPQVQAEAVAEEVTDDVSARRATQALWQSITSSSDGFVDRWFNRPVGRLVFSKPLIWTPVTPNQISLVSIAVGLAGAWLIASGNYASTIWGAMLFQLSAVIDCVDGDVARIVFKESKLGKWLDLGGDQVVHIGIFGSIAWGLHRAGSSAPVLILGSACIVGALLSFAVILHGILRPPAGPAQSRLQALIDGATSRDFSVLVLALACLGRLEWFLWLTAIGSQVFWITALVLQRRRDPAR